MAPMPPTVRIAAQAPAPPRRSLATAGPRTCRNMKKTLPIPNSSTVDHSHVRAVNSRQPARSSCRKRWGCPPARGAMRIRASSAAHRKKDDDQPIPVVSVAPNSSRYSRSRNAPSPSPSRLPTTGTRCTIVTRAASRAGGASSPRVP